MPFVVETVTAADLKAAKQIYSETDGGFATPLLRFSWPIPSPDDTDSLRRRAEWGMQHQLDIFHHDPSARFMKATDAEMGELVNIARFQYFEHGYRDAENSADLKLVGLKDPDDPETWPEDLNANFYRECIEELYSQRRGWMGDGRYWVLTTMVTREPFRKRGAGSQILEWGLEQAKKEGVPVYLEAAPAAKGLYEKHGWREVGRQVTEVKGLKIELSRMRADP